MLHSLKSKLIASLCGMAFFTMIIAMILSSVLLLKSYRDSVRKQLQAAATSLVTLGISDFSELRDFGAFNSFIENALQMDRVDKIIRIFNSKQQVIFTTVGNRDDKLPATIQMETRIPKFLTITGEKRTYESLILPYEARGKLFWLQIVIPLPQYGEILESLWGLGLLSFGLLLAVAILLSGLLTSRLIRPVRSIAEHLQKMDPRHMEQWKPMGGELKGEYLGPITEGVNLLIRKTQIALLRLKKMARYVAHEIRTPLTIIQGEAETLLMKPHATPEEYSKVLQSSLEEVRRMSGIVTSILGAADDRQSPSDIEIQEVDLVDWIEGHLPTWQKMLKRPLSFQKLNGNKVAPVSADPELLFHLIDNLIRNIKDHTPPQTSCDLSLKQEKENVLLSLSDNGPGISEGAMDEGIGLHLCQRIAELCCISLQFSNQPRGGLKVTLGFPKSELQAH